MSQVTTRKQRYIRTDLHDAVRSLKASNVQSVLQQGKVDVNARLVDKTTPLFCAVSICEQHENTAENLQMIEILLRAGANPNKRQIHNTVLNVAVMRGTAYVKKIVDVCKELGTPLDPHKTNLFGETVVHYSATHNQVETLKLLIAAGADVNVTGYDGVTPLDMAIENKSNDCVKLLMQHNAEKRKTAQTQPAIGSVPEFIAAAFHKDSRMLQHEIDFGGTLWCDCLEAFYAGKRPRRGLCVEFTINFTAIVAGLTATSMRGIIDEVHGPKKFTAILQLNGDHAIKLKKVLGGEWEAVIEWDNYKEYPYVITSLRRLTEKSDESKSYANLVAFAKEEEEKFGRRVAKAKAKPCWVLRGDEHDGNCESGEDYNVIIEVILSENGVLTYLFENGETDVITDTAKIPYLLRMLISRNRALVAKGLGARIVLPDLGELTPEYYQQLPTEN